MPVIGQQSHAHFTPIAAAILQRITSSFVYKYNVTQSIFRITVVSTYQYNVNYLLSTAHIYFYHLNPTGAVGPTRLYLRAVLNALPNLPTVEGSTLTPNKVVDAETVNRTLSLIRGGSQSSLVLTSNAAATLQRYYFGRFISDTLSGVTSITAQNWTFNFAVKESDTNANFPAAGTNQPVRIVGCVWRPSTQNTLGDIIDANSNSTIDEASTTLETVQTTTFSGGQVLGVQDGDVLCFEVWFEITQSAATAYTDTFYFDGTTVNTIKNTTVTSHASYLETPQGLVFGAPLARVSKSTIQKYNIIGRISLARLYKYNVTQSALLSRVYRYNVTQSAILTPDFKYNIIGRISKLSIAKYNILVRKQSPKIFRYALLGRLLSSKIYKYTITARLAAPSSKIYKYNIANRIQVLRIYRYNLTTAVHLTRIYRYSLTGRTSHPIIYKYNIASAILRVSVNSIYDYSINEQISLTNEYPYDILNSLSLSRIYRYDLKVRATVSRIYRYAILNRRSLSRIYRYNLTVRILSSRNYIYSLLKRIAQPRLYKYNLANRIVLPRIYRYSLGGSLHIIQKYVYSLIGRISLVSKYRYSLVAVPSNIIWQITGKNTDFPDTLENLVRDFIKENWSITDPAIGANPAITTVQSHQHQTQVDNFAYDNFRSYYIRVKEIASEVRNRQIRLNTYEFATPIELEVFSRRLKKGEAFTELNNMMNELLRIFGTFESDGIFGVEGISIDRISSMEKERPPAENLWARRLRIILHYYRISAIG